MTTTRTFLIDGSALAYRSHFALIRKPLINSKGMNTSATYGFVSALLRLEKDKEPDQIFVTFDTSRSTFRTEKYPEYKATRERMPQEMRSQVPIILDLVEKMGYPLVTVDGYEADDVLATLATQGAALGHEIYIVSADKDLMQLVNDQIKVYNPWSRTGLAPTYNADEVEKKLGVRPEQVVDLLALMGDASDNIPGVPGVGQKTACKLLKQFGDLDSLLANIDKIKAARARNKMEEHKDKAILSRDLVQLVKDVEGVEYSSLKCAEPNKEALREAFQDLEFKDLLRRFSSDVQEDEHVYEIVKTDKQLKALIEELNEAPYFVFDLETTSLDVFDAKIVGLAFSCKKSKASYVPLTVKKEAKKGETASLFGDHEAAMVSDGRLEALKPLLEDASKAKGGQNIKYDIMVLENHGVKVQGITFDTLLESYLLDPSSRSHSLDDLSLRYLNYKKISTKQLLKTGKKKKTMDELPVEEVGEYACEDADITFRLHEMFRQSLSKRPGLQKLYKEVELPLMHVLKAMEMRGVKVDTKKLSALSKEFQEKLDDLSGKVFKLAGETFNLNSPKQLRVVLYDKLEIHKAAGVRPKKTSKGELSTNVSVLERLAEKHELPQLILDYRSFAKLKSTYVDSLPKLIKDATGRIHSSFNQAVAATGRLSSSEPNLQNIPIRSAEGMRIRSTFIAGREGWKLVSADYSQIELRLLAHFSEEESLIEAFKTGADIHRATAARVFKEKPEDVTALMRSRAKAINFGIIYGMGAPSLARQIDTTVPEAEDFIANYFETYPKVRAYLDSQIEMAQTHGYVETILKRRRDLPEIHSSNPQLQGVAERMATNTPIQGSAADLIKVAMIAIEKKLAGSEFKAEMLLQVHDELVFEAPEGECEALTAMVKAEMEGAFELRVPLLVEVGTGDDWLAAH